MQRRKWHDVHVIACDLGPGAPLPAGKRLPAAPIYGKVSGGGIGRHSVWSNNTGKARGNHSYDW